MYHDVQTQQIVEENCKILNIIKTAKEYSHIMVVGTLGGVGTYEF